MSRIIVIGAGMGGMAAAARLAVKGHSVTVVEQAATYGGKLGVYERDGFVFDTGPSLMTLPAVYRDLFNKTGKPLEESIDLIELEPSFRYRWTDGSTVTMPGADTARAAAALQAGLGGSNAEDWNALMRHAARMWDLTRPMFLEQPLAGLRSILPMMRDRANAKVMTPWLSLRGIGKKYLSDPRTAMLLDRYATYTGSDPRKATSALATVPYMEQTFGAFHIAGGLRSLGTALFNRCIERGVTFEFSLPVTAITRGADGAVTGVDTATGHIPADIVVANVDARQLARTLITDEKSLQPALRQQQSLSGFCMYLAVEGKTPEVAHHNVWFGDDYDAEFDSIFGVGRHSSGARPIDDPVIYACVPQDESMAPAGCESWFLLINAAPHSTEKSRRHVNWETPGLADAYAERILDVLAARGVDLRPRIRWQQLRTPADIERDTGSIGGAIYGTASHGAMAAFRRPANQSKIPGLYLVGGSSHPGGGLPLVGMSASIVAELIGRA